MALSGIQRLARRQVSYCWTKSPFAGTYPEFQPVQVPQTLNKQPVFLWQVTAACKLRSCISSRATVLQNVIDQCLLVVDIQR